ncbi:transcription elongation factor, mitochondrial [Genypterus blacodes]|uniref:transcription elongation factor, mitochondrial n=1 Tax=Genypterus blacodes TaxID=154954 RepID=UPI003F76B524
MWVARQFLSSFAQRGFFLGRAGLLRRSPHGALPELEPRYLQCTCCWKCRVPVAGLETLDSFIEGPGSCEESTTRPRRSSSPQRSLDSCYTPEQRDTILQVLNGGSLTELAAVKLLRGHKGSNIVEYRTKNGPFMSLDSLVNVPKLKHKSAVVIFNSILNPVKRKVKPKLAKFIQPEVDRHWLERASSIVSLVCGINNVAWAHVDRGMTVLKWQQVECPNFMTGTYTASAYLTDISSVVSLLPSATFYIIEKPSISIQNTTLFPILAHMRTVEAMLFALLEPRNTEPQANIPPKVLNMKRHAVGRHFDLIVGDSRTSGAELVRKLMMESVTQELPRLIFPQQLLVKYRDAFQMGREREGEMLCDALLQAVAFYDLLSESSD